ncbi:helix-turn-helix domain-containing protein [Risungbinella massiliensis]|uniref:helix-turn-helix domain-containing protein n=1 Tax=Risungbinella massiliensis TaxID=1329796 RepID=UPI0005CC869E|nr:helix-turn-helix transcriptional regulator [Risungbinella massiliensis]
MVETPYELSLEQLKHIGKILRQSRKDQKRILDELADDDISTSTISNLERGERVSWEKIVIYAQKLGYSTEEIPKLLENERDRNQQLLQQLEDIANRIDLVGADNALEKLRKLKLSATNPLKANAEYLTGKCYTRKKKWVAARSHYMKALQIIKRYPDFYKTNLKSSCHLHLARTFYSQENDLVTALKHADQGLESLVTNTEEQTKYLLLIGKVVYLQNLNQDTETVKHIIDKLWEQKDRIQSIDAVISLHEAKATLLNKMELYEEALESVLEGIELAQKNSILDRVLELLTAYGSICISLGDYAKAENHLALGLDMKDKIRKKYQKEYLFVTTLVVLGKLLVKQKHIEKARNTFMEAVQLGEKTKSKEVLRYHDALVALGDCELMLENFQEATISYRKALEIAQIQSTAQKNPMLWIEKEHHLWIKLGICYEKFDNNEYKKCMEKSFEFNVQYMQKKGVITWLNNS